MNKIRTLSVVAVASLAAYAAGAVSPSAPEPAALSSANYEQATQAALGLFETLSALPSDAQATDASPLLRFGKDQLPRVKEWLATESAQAAGVTVSDAVPCTGGGSITYSHTYPTQADSTLGERYTLSASQCVESIGTIDGQLIVTLQNWSESAQGYSYQAALDYRNLSIVSASAKLVGQGPLSLDYAESFATGSSSTGLSTSSFAVTAVDGDTISSRTLTNYSTRQHNTTALVIPQMNGTVSASALGGKAVTIATLRQFVTAPGDDYPSSGRATLAGAGASKVQITAIDAQQVRIELDADGDGSYDTRTTRAWRSLI